MITKFEISTNVAPAHPTAAELRGMTKIISPTISYSQMKGAYQFSEEISCENKNKNRKNTIHYKNK